MMAMKGEITNKTELMC